MSYYTLDGDPDTTYSRHAVCDVIDADEESRDLIYKMRDGQVMIVCGHELRKNAGYPTPTEEEPDFEQLESWVFDSVCDATDGCSVEPDGACEHGHPSWLIVKGLI